MNTKTLNLLKLFGFFLLFYAIALPIWLGVKAPYQNVINTTSFLTSSWIYDIKMLQIHRQDDGTTIVTATNRYSTIGLDGKSDRVIFDILLDIDAITFNVPMTLALLLAIVSTLKSRRSEKIDAIVTGMALLAALHFVTMFVVCISLYIGTMEHSKDLAIYLQDKHLPKELLINLGSLLSSYAARFEPFLIAIFIWWKLSLKEDLEAVDGKMITP